MDYPCTPDLATLASGMETFGWGDDNVDEQDYKPLFDYIRNYIFKVKGVTRMKRLMDNNKGLTFIDDLTVEDLLWPR